MGGTVLSEAPHLADPPAAALGLDGTAASAAVRLAGVTKAYGSFEAVKAMDLVIEPGELFTLLGPSGSGKTTVLRMIAGLITPTSGELWVGGTEVQRIPTYARNIGVVFQSLALFPHMDVYGNIAFPLRMRRVGRAEIARRIAAALDVVGLPAIAGRQIHELSGGQQQRVALARALVYEPELLLLDEPFGALDLKLREEMQLEIVRLHHDIGVTIVNVTHDQREALVLSDRIGVMHEGVLEQVGSGEEIYRNPQSAFIGRFIGNTSLLHGDLVSGASGRVLAVAGLDRPLRVERVTGASSDGGAAALVLRAEALRLLPAGTADPEGLEHVPGRVALRAFQGSTVQYEVDVPGQCRPLRVECSADAASFATGDAVTVAWDPSETPVVSVP
jgi:putative spermidine/putrescine transport system ATP-binding protein